MTSPQARPVAPTALSLAVAPAGFVLIWSTGFIVARFGMPYAPPLKFLALRYALSAISFLIWAIAARVHWPRSRAQWMHLCVVGIMMNVLYLGGVWSAVKAGMGAGLTALIVGLQPALTAAWVSSRGTPLHRRQWLGLGLGLAGLLLVVWQKLGVGEISAFTLACTIGALLAITLGTLYQKRFVEACDVRSANFVQLCAAFVVTLPFSLFEPEGFQWTLPNGAVNAELVGAMGWSVFGLTLGGSSLLYLMIQRGAATSVTSLFYLVPATTSVLAWLLFSEPLTPCVLAGLALSAAGVCLAVTRR
ncbi:DMT family transporter [Cupriavidus taiwanensis]|uniref:DMT family transporter n=1 Tax=Cupriavidus taiwanensis TaxID=164546 RepID=UPI000E1AEE1C|nr:DMT family transporter [Cupriavidus taiwanensis]SOZ33496.1 Candidate transporter [Cupriavidus taiwanensis]SPA25475.1 Candidate transporter [Cupriavidus taiwanensis]